MIHHVFKFAALAAITAFTATLAQAGSTTKTTNGLEITAPWTRATPPGSKVAAGYVTIKNGGTDADRLIGGTFSAAKRTEVHSMSMENGVMKMEQLADGIEIKPGATIVLKPGGLHLMFMELATDIKQGAPVKGSLKFEKAGDVAIDFSVAALGAKSPSADKHEKMKHENMDHGHGNMKKSEDGQHKHQ